MRHKKKYRKLGMPTNQRKMLLRGLAVSLLEHGSIVTTKARAKELRSYVERIISKVKRENETHARRLVFRKLQNKFAVKKLFDEYKDEFVSRPGGYTRIHLLGNRRGDAAEMARISLVLEDVIAAEATPEAVVEVEEPKAKKAGSKKKAETAGKDEPKATKAKPRAKAEPKKKTAPVEPVNETGSEEAQAE